MERNGVTISSFPRDPYYEWRCPVTALITKGKAVVFFQAIRRPSKTVIEACKGGVDLFIHETFPSATVFREKRQVSRRNKPRWL